MIGITNIPDVAKIIVTAPAGTNAVIKLSGTTIDSASVSSGSTTCSLTVRKTSSNYSLEATYDGTTITHTININRLGKKYYDEFTFIAYIVVTTFPGASVSATGPATIASKTADNSGVCTLTVPTGGRGTYSVTSSYSSWSKTQSNFNVSSYNQNFPLTIYLDVHAFTFTVGSVTRTFTANSTTTSYDECYFYKSGANWEFYMKTDGTFNFRSGANIDLFMCGGGQPGYNGPGINNTNSGGNGGARKTVSNISIGNGNISVVAGTQSNNSTFGNYTSSGGTVSTGGGQNNWTFYAGQDGGYSFDDSSAKGPDGNSRKVGAGGGHGGYSETDGTSQGSFTVQETNGGSYGGGKGGHGAIDGTRWYADDGQAGQFYGAGGGGGGGYYHMNISDRRGEANPGNGARGFVAIRNKR